jgi:hypothetical protein
MVVCLCLRSWSCNTMNRRLQFDDLFQLHLPTLRLQLPPRLQPSYWQATQGGLGTMILSFAAMTEDRKAVGAPRWRKKRCTHSGLPSTEIPNNKSSQLRGCRRAVNFWIGRIGPNNTNCKLWTIRRLQTPTCLPKRLDQCAMLTKHDAQRVNGLRIRTSPALTNGPKKKSSDCRAHSRCHEHKSCVSHDLLPWKGTREPFDDKPCHLS